MKTYVWAGGLLALAALLGAGLASAQAPSATAADLLARGDAANTAMNYAEALRWYRAAADLGDANAEVEVGQMYALARGAPEDQAQALFWYRKAADQGNADGEFYVGVQYESGWGVVKDYGQALAWFRKSADHGNAEAAEALGMAYENGVGVPADFGQARIWLDRAVAGGDAAAEVGLCAPYERAWIQVAGGKDISAMDRVIAKIDPYCGDLLTHAKARRNELAQAGQTNGAR